MSISKVRCPRCKKLRTKNRRGHGSVQQPLATWKVIDGTEVCHVCVERESSDAKSQDVVRCIEPSGTVATERS